MAQISRPIQIALVGIVMLAGVWLFALRGHAQSAESSASSPAPAQEQNPAAPTSVYHGPVPGVSGLTHAIAKAHGAVATSQQNAAQLAQRSAQASSASAKVPVAPAGAPATSKTPPTKAPTAPAKAVAAPARSTSTGTKAKTVAPAGPAAAEAATAAARNRALEATLKSGGIALVLFWNRLGSEDAAVAKVVHGLASAHVSVYESPPAEVASFGALTRGIQVLQTPTLLVIGPSRQAHVITGLTDAYSVQQAIAEARH